MKTLKNILVIVFMFLLTWASTAQEGISFSVLQDVKLGLGLDKEHNNDKPTLDIIALMNWEGKQQTHYYFAIQTLFEHAQLSSGDLTRYGVNGVWNFNQLIVENLTVSPSLGIGVLRRPNSGGLLTYSLGCETSLKVLKNVSIVLRNEWFKRPDLKNKKLGYNLAFGINYKI